MLARSRAGSPRYRQIQAHFVGTTDQQGFDHGGVIGNRKALYRIDSSRSQTIGNQWARRVRFRPSETESDIVMTATWSTGTG